MCLGMANVTGENEAVIPILPSILDLSMAGDAESDPMKTEGLCSNSVWCSTGEIKSLVRLETMSCKGEVEMQSSQAENSYFNCSPTTPRSWE